MSRRAVGLLCAVFIVAQAQAANPQFRVDDEGLTVWLNCEKEEPLSATKF